MPASAAKLADLRQMLAARFPQAERPAGGVLPTGIPAVDDVAGGLPRHAITELIRPSSGSGAHLFLAQLLSATRALPARAAFVDAADQFDPGSLPPADLEHLVWVRCRAPADALPVSDLLAREANLDLVALDLSGVTINQLRRIPATTWYRLQRAVEQTDLAVLVITPAALVPSAQLRLQLGPPHPFATATSTAPTSSSTSKSPTNVSASPPPPEPDPFSRKRTQSRFPPTLPSRAPYRRLKRPIRSWISAFFFGQSSVRSAHSPGSKPC